MSSFVYQAGCDKRNRNPNWTDTEITRFLTILMEEPVLHDLNAQRNKQVFCYVSQKMVQEGSEKSWDQCRVKLKNLKSQWRYVRDRVPDIEDANLEDEAKVREIMMECQAKGVSPTCIKHLRLLKQFQMSLMAVRRGQPPPKYNNSPLLLLQGLPTDMMYVPPFHLGMANAVMAERMNSAEDDNLNLEDGDDDTEDSKPLMVDFPNDNSGSKSPSRSPGPSHLENSRMSESEKASQSTGSKEAFSRSAVGRSLSGDLPQLRVMSPAEVNSSQHRKRLRESRERESDCEPRGPKRQALGFSSSTIFDKDQNGHSSNIDSRTGDLVQIVSRLQGEMTDKFLEFQRESEMRYLTWEQDRWRMEQAMMEKWRLEQRSAMERWRAEQRQHEKERMSIFCELVTRCTDAILNSSDKGAARQDHQPQE